MMKGEHRTAWIEAAALEVGQHAHAHPERRESDRSGNNEGKKEGKPAGSRNFQQLPPRRISRREVIANGGSHVEVRRRVLWRLERLIATGPGHAASRRGLDSHSGSESQLPARLHTKAPPAPIRSPRPRLGPWIGAAKTQHRLEEFGKQGGKSTFRQFGR